MTEGVKTHPLSAGLHPAELRWVSEEIERFLNHASTLRAAGAEALSGGGGGALGRGRDQDGDGVFGWEHAIKASAAAAAAAEASPRSKL